MKKNRVECSNCEYFIPPIQEKNNIIGKIIKKALCKEGHRVMFRMPKFHSDSYILNNTGGYFRYCNEFKKRNNDNSNK